MAWSGQEFVASLEVPSVVDGSEARVLKTHFLKGLLSTNSIHVFNLVIANGLQLLLIMICVELMI